MSPRTRRQVRRFTFATAVAVAASLGTALVAWATAYGKAVASVDSIATVSARRVVEPVAKELGRHETEVAIEKPHMLAVARGLTGAMQALCEATPRATAKCLRALSEAQTQQAPSPAPAAEPRTHE